MFKDRGRQRQRYAQAVARRAARNLGERLRQGAQLLGDGAAPDLPGRIFFESSSHSPSATALPVRSGKSCSTTQGSSSTTGTTAKPGGSAARSSSRGWSLSGSRWKIQLSRARLPQISRRCRARAPTSPGALGGDNDLRRYRRGVEPTNNHAEREIRAFVLWRKRFAPSAPKALTVMRANSRGVLALCCEQRDNRRRSHSDAATRERGCRPDRALNRFTDHSAPPHHGRIIALLTAEARRAISANALGET